jgi:thioesterase domain-containing protein
VYAFQALGAAPGTKPLRTVTELASHYISAIRTTHPQGPYVVAGWSFGGYVAVEMARQLDDNDVAHLILLDTIALGDGPHRPLPGKDLVSWFFKEMMWPVLGDAVVDLALPDDATDVNAMLEAISGQASAAGLIPEGSSQRLIRRLFGIFAANYEAVLNYHHDSLDRDVTLLRARHTPPEFVAVAHRMVGDMFESPTNGWERLQPRSLQVIDVAGDHLTMMSEPNVAEVADQLSAVLNREATSHRGLT